MSFPRNPSRYVVVGAFTLLALAWIYGVLNTARMDDSTPATFWDSTSAALLVAGVLVVTGFLIGRWWAVGLAFLPSVVAIPAGYEVDGYPEVPIWFYLGVQAVVYGIPLIAGGLVLRRLMDFAIRARRRALHPPKSERA